MRLSALRHTRPPERLGLPAALSDANRRGVAELLDLRKSTLDSHQAMLSWSGHTFGDMVDLHTQRFNLSPTPLKDEFVAVAYTHPDVRITNMLGCQLAGAEFAERAVIGVTGHGMGTVHEALSLLGATDYSNRRGRLWIVDQESPFPLGGSGAIEGRNLVCTIDINHDDAVWQYFGTEVDDVRLPGTPTTSLADAWQHALTVPPQEASASRSSVVDIDLDLGMRWTSSIGVLATSGRRGERLVTTS
jgi:hypothetical protein